MPEVKGYGLEKIRELAGKRVSASSLRAVASEIGISFSGLRKLLAGGSPHPSTVKKLTAWYVRSRKAGPPKKKISDRAERAETDAAIELLQGYLAADGDERLAEERRRKVSWRLFGPSFQTDTLSQEGDVEEPIAGDAIRNPANASLDDVSPSPPEKSSRRAKRDEAEEE
jgi:hypothetical protein